MLTTNYSKSLNIFFKDICKLSIIDLIGNTKRKVAQWFLNYREEASNCYNILPLYVKEEIDLWREKTKLYVVFPHSHPCSYIVAIIMYQNIDPYHYCEYYFLS